MSDYEKVFNLGELEDRLCAIRDQLCSEENELREEFDETARKIRDERMQKVTDLVEVMRLEKKLYQLYDAIGMIEQKIDEVMDELDDLSEQSIAILQRIMEENSNPTL